LCSIEWIFCQIFFPEILFRIVSPFRMGLCKCPRKKVTNQFCFEHKVNVCEYCMIDGPHKLCYIAPYLNWLENSNFDSKCQICSMNFNMESGCVRLCCYHLFHLNCLNSYANRMPANTAPAGYTCPICSKPIFSINPKSPVGKSLENAIRSFDWAMEGLKQNPNESSSISSESMGNGQMIYKSLLDDSTRIDMMTNNEDDLNHPKIFHNSFTTIKPIGTNLSVGQYSAPINVNNVKNFISTNGDLCFGSSSSMRSKFDNESRRSLLSSVNDIIEDKYRTKSPVEFLSRWLRSRSTYMRNHTAMSSLSLYKKFIIFGLISFLFLFIVIHYFIKYGRQSAESDPFLNPENDPNLRNANI
ncbi:Zinc finger protein-like 1, partial [Sarcoptes scabiei]